MKRGDVEELVVEVIAETLPNLDVSTVHPGSDLADLGANSIDRNDIFLEAMIRCELDIPLVELAPLKTVGALIDHLHNRTEEASS